MWGYSSIQTNTGAKFSKTQTFREHCSLNSSQGRTQEEQYTYTKKDGHLQVKKLDLRKKGEKNQLYWHLDFGELWENTFLLHKPASW